MKVAIIGVGFVGTACAKAMMLRGTCNEIVLIDLPARDQHTRGVRNDLRHGAPLCPPVRLTVGGYEDLEGASVIVITAGINEKEGGAIDRADPWGRQRLLPRNAEIYRDVVSNIVGYGGNATIVAVTDPPDTLADVAREEVRKAGGEHTVLSAGTFLDTLRFRIQIAEKVGCAARSVRGYVLGEHGKTQVYAWSSVEIGGVPIADLVPADYDDLAAFRKAVERDVIDANIDIIDATDASQHGIGIVTARIVEAILRDERVVIPVGVWHEQYGVTLSLPSVIGSPGIVRVLDRGAPATEQQTLEEESLRASAAYLGEALERTRSGAGFDQAPTLDWAQWSRTMTA